MHFNEDKDALTDKEYLKVQNNYVDDILEEGHNHHLTFLQFIVGIVINSQKQILYIENPIFDPNLIYDNKSDKFKYISDYWKSIFDNEPTIWKNIGKTLEKNQYTTIIYMNFPKQ